MSGAPRCRAQGGAANCADPDCPERRAFLAELQAPVTKILRPPTRLAASSLPKHARAAVELYIEQMIAEGMAEEGETVADYRYEVREEELADFVDRYCEGDFANSYPAVEFAQHHAEVITDFEIEHHGAGPRWPVIVDDENPNYIEDGFHRLHDYVRAGVKTIPTLRMYYEVRARALPS